jgi:hypothetical protein
MGDSWIANSLGLCCAQPEERTSLIKFVPGWILEGGVIAAGIVFVVIITIMAHSSNTSYSVGEFDSWALRPSFYPMHAAEMKTQDEYQSSASEYSWEE